MEIDAQRLKQVWMAINDMTLVRVRPVTLTGAFGRPEFQCNEEATTLFRLVPYTLLETRVLLWVMNFSMRFLVHTEKLYFFCRFQKYPDRKIQKPIG